MSRRTGVVDFLSDIADDIKDFVDDEVLDRGRRTERDLRRAGRNATEWDDRPSRRDDLREVRAAIRALAQQIGELARDAAPAPTTDTRPAGAGSAPVGEPADRPVEVPDATASDVLDREAREASSPADAVGSAATDIIGSAAASAKAASEGVADGVEAASDAVADGAATASDTVVNGARRATATATAAADTGADAADAASDAAADTGADAADAASDAAADTGADTADEVSDAAADGAGDVSDAAASVVAEAEETVRRAHAEAGAEEPSPREDELPINGYPQLTAAEIVERLRAVSQQGLELIGRYERAHQHRSTVLTRVESLRGEAPWPGYDEQTVVEVRRALAGADEERRRTVRAYETRHKHRQGVLDITVD